VELSTYGLVLLGITLEIFKDQPVLLVQLVKSALPDLLVIPDLLVHKVKLDQLVQKDYKVFKVKLGLLVLLVLQERFPTMLVTITTGLITT